MPAGPYGVGRTVGGVSVGALLPVLDATSSGPEELGTAQVDQQLLGCDELGVAPLPVARGDQVGVSTADLPRLIRLLGVRCRGEVTGAAHQTVGVLTTPVRLASQSGTGSLGAVDSPDLATIPPPDEPAPLRLQPGRQTSKTNHGVVNLGVGEGVEVDRGELIDHRRQPLEQLPNHARIVSNMCSLRQPLPREKVAGSVDTCPADQRACPSRTTASQVGAVTTCSSA